MASSRHIEAEFYKYRHILYLRALHLEEVVSGPSDQCSWAAPQLGGRQAALLASGNQLGAQEFPAAWLCPAGPATGGCSYRPVSHLVPWDSELVRISDMLMLGGGAPLDDAAWSVGCVQLWSGAC